MSKHRKFPQNRRTMFSLAAGTVLAAAGMAGVVTHAHAAPTTHAENPAPATHAHAAAPGHAKSVAEPLSSLSAAERANALLVPWCPG